MKPVLFLFVLAPLIAEFLLGNLTLHQLSYFPVLASLYGGGSGFIRELARRTQRGWPTIILLAVAFGVIEEALATQSLFNPHFLDLRLLDYGLIPAWGIAAPWTVYVIILHTVWSITVPIALVEAVFGAQRKRPWLGKFGVTFVGALFVFGVMALRFAMKSKENFTASNAQATVSLLAVAGLAGAAFGLFRPVSRLGSTEPAPDVAYEKCHIWILGALSFVSGSAFHLVNFFASSILPNAPIAEVAIEFVLVAVALTVVRAVHRKFGWPDVFTDALSLGALLVYCWWGFFLTIHVHGTASIPGQCVPLLLVLSTLAVHSFRLRNKKNTPANRLA